LISYLSQPDQFYMRKIFFYSIGFSLFLTACENSAGNRVSPRPLPSGSQPLPPLNSGSHLQQAQPMNNSTALNPAHGQPGHRCDIQVGAPLNSAPANPVQPAMVTQQASPVQADMVLNQPVNSGVKLNPAHGQPGHRCDIQVGAPLNSAPANPVQPTTIVTPQSGPVLNQPAGSQVRLNPAHGEPGHDCSIPVGQPLIK
jgi:hypothetical protein